MKQLVETAQWVSEVDRERHAVLMENLTTVETEEDLEPAPAESPADAGEEAARG